MLIKLQDGVFVSADDVLEVAADYCGNRVKVVTSQRTHSVPPDYGKSITEKFDDITQRINAACAE